MKYIKNLIKRKEYLTLFICFIFFALGAFAFVYNLVEVLNIGIQWNSISGTPTAYSNEIGIIASTNIGMIIVSGFVMYIGAVFLPSAAPGFYPRGRTRPRSFLPGAAYIQIQAPCFPPEFRQPRLFPAPP